MRWPVPGPPWDDEMEDAFTRITSLDEETVHAMHDEHHMRFLQGEFEEWFAEAFMQHKHDPNNELDPHDRKALRDAWFDYMTDLGYDRDEFHWNEWREHMGYQ